MLAAETPSYPGDWRLLWFDEAGSTQDIAKSLAEEGAAEGTLIVADRQTAGRGRRGRIWISPSGNLHASLILEPRVAAGVAGQLAFVAGLAMGDAIIEACGRDGVELAHRLKLKWPNDILIDGAKVAGLLLEASPTPAGRVDRLIVGVGVNIVAAPDDTPYPTMSLRAAGAARVEAKSLALGFLSLIERAIEAWRRVGFSPCLAEWTKRAHGIGGPVTIRDQAGETSGLFRGLDPDGALLLDLGDNGPPRRILTGDLFFAAR